ncbi:MAG: GntR family transcriptional regulator, partial [Frankia sp.]|nr:GntR family transcriptional regulator [Frankia sp.]
MATVADRILAHLAGVPAGLDDGKLAEAIGASRSTVNNACRRLADQGRLTRAVGPDGRIVNRLEGATAPAAEAAPVAAAAEEAPAAAPAAEAAPVEAAPVEAAAATPAAPA